MANKNQKKKPSNGKSPADLSVIKAANKQAVKARKMDLKEKKLKAKEKNATQVQKTARTATRSAAITAASSQAAENERMREETRRLQIEADKQVALAKNRAAQDWNSIIGLGEGGDTGSSSTGNYGGKVDG